MSSAGREMGLVLLVMIVVTAVSGLVIGFAWGVLAGFVRCLQ